MHTSKLNKFCQYHLSLPPCELVQIHAVGGPSDFMWVYTTRISAKKRSKHRNS